MKPLYTWRKLIAFAHVSVLLLAVTIPPPRPWSGYFSPSPPEWAQARGRLLLLPDGTLDDAPAAYEAWLEEF